MTHSYQYDELKRSLEAAEGKEATEKILRRMLLLRPDDVEATRTLVSILLERNAVDKAVELIQKAVIFDGANHAYWLELVQYSLRRLRLEDVIETVGRAVEAMPDDIELRLALAELFEKHGCYDLGLVHAKEAAEKQPQSSKGQLMYARLLRRKVVNASQQKAALGRHKESLMKRLKQSWKSGDYQKVIQLYGALQAIGRTHSLICFVYFRLAAFLCSRRGGRL